MFIFLKALSASIRLLVKSTGGRVWVSFVIKPEVSERFPDLLMTTSQIQRRLVNFGFYHHPATASFSWAGSLHLPLAPVTHLIWDGHKLVHSHFITGSGCQRWSQIISWSFPRINQHPTPPPLQHAALPHTHTTPISLSSIHHLFLVSFYSICHSLTHTLILSVTSVNIAFLSMWQREHINPPSVNTLTVKTVVPWASNKIKQDPAFKSGVIGLSKE